MSRNSIREVDVAQKLAVEWQLGAYNDTVVVSIYDMDDNAQDVDQAAMTNESGGLFSYSWTPTEQHNYFIDYFNQTLNTHDYEYVRVADSLTDVM